MKVKAGDIDAFREWMAPLMDEVMKPNPDWERVNQIGGELWDSLDDLEVEK